jgi:hypothetical protein
MRWGSPHVTDRAPRGTRQSHRQRADTALIDRALAELLEE